MTQFDPLLPFMFLYTDRLLMVYKLTLLCFRKF
jgi:hypothetical protein